MSISQKFRRFSQWICIQHFFDSRHHSLCILSEIVFDYQPFYCEKLTERIKKSKKKGYNTQVRILMSEKVFQKYNLKNQIWLKLQGVQLM